MILLLAVCWCFAPSLLRNLGKGSYTAQEAHAKDRTMELKSHVHPHDSGRCLSLDMF